jgi:hypothetical protein
MNCGMQAMPQLDYTRYGLILNLTLDIPLPQEFEA